MTRFWRIWRRLFGTLTVTVFAPGEESAVFDDEEVVWCHAGRRCLTVVCLWGGWKHDPEYRTVTYCFPYAHTSYWTKER